MAISIYDLDEEDDSLIEGESIEEQPLVTETNNSEDDFISDYLRSRGIEDSSKIKFENDNGDIEERDWNSLTREEKFNILNTPLPSHDDTDLTDEEIDFLNQLRERNLTPNQFINQLSSNKEPIEPQYKIDDLSDDEIFILDLESRVGELTDEQAAQALANSKQDEILFSKQVEGIRKEYREREDYAQQQQQAELEEQQQEAYNKFQDSVINSISNFNSIGNLDLNFEDSDRNMLADFMLSRDDSGNNPLWQALQEPETLTKAAWFILNGEDALNGIADYFTNQIKLVSQNQYKKGYEEGRKGLNPSRPTIVINENKQNQHRQYKTAEDLFDDED